MLTPFWPSCTTISAIMLLTIIIVAPMLIHYFRALRPQKRSKTTKLRMKESIIYYAGGYIPASSISICLQRCSTLRQKNVKFSVAFFSCSSSFYNHPLILTTAGCIRIYCYNALSMHRSLVQKCSKQRARTARKSLHLYHHGNQWLLTAYETSLPSVRCPTACFSNMWRTSNKNMATQRGSRAEDSVLVA